MALAALLLLLFFSVASGDLEIGLGGSSSPAISIGIGAGTGSAPSQGPLQPSDFPNDRLYRAYLVIQRFKKTITCDPHGVTATWSGADICGSYAGFFCATPPGLTDTPTVAAVDFNGYGLAAPTLSGFIDQLSDLAFFHANSNGFAGQVPADLSCLQYFYELDVSNNRLTGGFPTDLLKIAKISFLDIRFNGHTGALPAGVFTQFTNPEAIFLNNNAFSGALPDTIGYSPVQYLTLANNMFTGPIPATIGHAGDSLLEVLFLNNQLSGCLPPELGALKKAVVLDAGTNALTGPIPASFSCLRKVQQLNLAHNQLYGDVPDAVCRLGCGAGALLNLSLSFNYFTSVGSSCLPLIKSCVLDVRQNCIPGFPDQRSPAECAQFERQPKKCAAGNCAPMCAPYAAAEDEEESSSSAAAAAPRYATYAALEHRKLP